jgi:two-component system, LytTR family, sensor histidine kinase AlgZ
MHPILSQTRRLALYLMAWIPLAALLAYLMDVTAGVTKREAIALSFPLCLVYAFICLSAWYSCRATPLDRSTTSKLLQVHALGAVVASGLWIASAELLAYTLAQTKYFPDITRNVSRTFPLLLITGVLTHTLIVNLFYVLIALEASREAEARVLQAGILAREAELKALKAQVNPHFLFNSLNSISALTSSDSAKAREMCILLGDFLRRTLGLGEKSVISLDEEMSLIRAFLAVEKIRFGSRINMEENIDKEASDVQVPPLLLQPLVENAVAHGIANLVEGGRIRLDAHCRDGNVSIVVENTYDPDAPPRRKGGVGLANVRQRLAARYGNLASFDVSKNADSFRVALKFPADREARSV